MSEEAMKDYIECARVQLPLPSEHKSDIIWLPVLSAGQARASLLEAPEPIWQKRYHKVYFRKMSIAGIVTGWEFHLFVPAKT